MAIILVLAWPKRKNYSCAFVSLEFFNLMIINIYNSIDACSFHGASIEIDVQYLSLICLLINVFIQGLEGAFEKAATTV